MELRTTTNRASLKCIATTFAATAAIAVLMPAFACAQGMGGMPGGMPNIPGGIFGKKETREVSGPSLSATNEAVAEIRVVGNNMIPTSQILDQLQTRTGRPFDPALVQNDVRKLTSRGWFVTVQPTYEQSANGRIVILTVVERPVVRYIEYLGNQSIRTKKLNKETDLKVGGPVDPYAVEEARKKIIALYQSNGYNNVQVTILKGNKPSDQGIVFVINEGTSQKIWKVVFEGNEFASDGQLRTKIETKKPLMYIFKGFVDRDQIDADVDRITAYYRAFGFFQAKVGRIPELHEDGKWMTLRFVISEGPRYSVENVSFMGNKIFATDSLSMGVEMPAGKPFEQAKMNKDVNWLKELYGSQGYVFADIQAEPIFLEETGKLNLLYKIKEGKRWRIGNIVVHINGDNPHTKIQTALNRLSMQTGEVADSREIMASERRLQACGLFLVDPARGVAPKITYHIPELDEEQLASEAPGYRGQSPDSPTANYRGFQLVQDAQSTDIATTQPAGPPLIAPPGAHPVAPQPTHQFTYKVPSATNSQPADDMVEVHIYLDSNAQQSDPGVVPAGYSVPQSQAPQSTLINTNSAQTLSHPVHHTTHRQPYDEPQTRSVYQRTTVRTQSPYQSPNTPSAATPSYRNPPAPNWTKPTTQQSQPQYAARPPYEAAKTGNPYQGLTVRTQSPYQPPSAAPASSSPYGSLPVGSTGPQTAGTSPYAVPQQPTTTSQPIFAAPQPQYPAPPVQYGGVPQVAQAPQYGPLPGGPLPVLPPDPSIAPAVPLPSNPAQVPYAADPFAPGNDPAVDLDVVLSEAQTGRLMLGVAVNSDAGLVGQILLDEQNFDWRRWPTTWDDLLSGKAFRGAGQRFRIEAAPGTEVQRYLVSFTEPYWMDTPVSLSLSGSYFDRRYEDWDEERLGGRVGLGYQWTQDDVSAGFSYRGEQVTITNPSSTTVPALNEVLGANALHGFKFTVANDTRDSTFLATQGHFLQLELEQVIGSFEYPRAVFDARKYFLLNERADHTGRHVLTASTRLGFTGSDTPIYDNFFAGGYTTLRGFEFRGASPVDQGVIVGGEFMWVNTLEYLFPITADDMIHGVVFVDHGTVEEQVEIENYRVAPGFGLRITIPAMGPAPIALDFAFPVLDAPTDEKQVFSFNIGLQH